MKEVYKRLIIFTEHLFSLFDPVMSPVFINSCKLTLPLSLVKNLRVLIEFILFSLTSYFGHTLTRTLRIKWFLARYVFIVLDTKACFFWVFNLFKVKTFNWLRRQRCISAHSAYNLGEVLGTTVSITYWFVAISTDTEGFELQLAKKVNCLAVLFDVFEFFFLLDKLISLLTRNRPIPLKFVM